MMDTIDFDHNKTDFNLKGKHSLVSCSDCHFNVHYGQFSINNKVVCSNCHTTYNWQPELFDHSKTRFTINGAHSELSCNKCHKKFDEGEKQFTKFKIEDATCKSCHS